MTYEHSITARWNQLGVDFAKEGKPEYPEKNPRSQIEIDKSQPTCVPSIRSRVHSGGGASVIPLGCTEARFKRRTFHVLNQIQIWFGK